MKWSVRTGVVAALALVAVGAGAAALAMAFGGGGGNYEAAPPVAAAPSGSALNPHPAAGKFTPNRVKLAGCHAQLCYEQAFGNVAYYQGPKAALALFDHEMKVSRAIESGCHRIAHMIGSASLAHFHGNVGEAFSRGSASCWSGYYHGILEHALQGASTKAQYASSARAVCSGDSMKQTTWLLYQCVHGLGHGLMLQSGYNLPFALSVCDRLQTGWDRSSCTGGVFMENINAANGSAYGQKTRWLKKSDLVFPCDAVSSRHKLYCYLMVTSRILQANGYDWRKTVSMCSGVERGWVATCFQSYGRDADGYTRQNTDKVLGLCALASGHESDCFYGAARDMTANYSSGQKAAGLCARAPADVRDRCFYGIGTIVGSFSSNAAENESTCRRLTAVYADACARGARA